MNTDRRFWVGLGIFVLIIGLICFFPYWFTSRSFRNLDFRETGQIGDTVGGIMGPFIAMAAAVLTFLAFWVQYQANIQQRDQYLASLTKQKEDSLAQEKIWRIERFENRFYELLKLHRANVDEMNIANKLRGRKCFVQMFYELKYCWIKVNDVIKATPKDIQDDYNYHKMNVFEFVYKIFFFGIGYNSEKQLMYSFNQPQMHLFQQCKSVLIEIQDRFESMRLADPTNSIYVLDVPLSGITDERTFEISYFPFDGHVNRLGHYYRHLFQTATYVVEQDETLLDYDMKYSYIKTLRAQLSNHEQLLLYYNSLAWFDAEWREILTKYRFIKNLPLPLANFGEAPEEHFKKEIQELREKGLEMFEWRE
jgi:Putative phage abortive infection protein